MDIAKQILIVGGGAGGIATATSLLKRDRSLDITIIEPSDDHYYQPGWTMVGAGIFSKEDTRRDTLSVWPSGVTRIKGEVEKFEPAKNLVKLSDGSSIKYETLVVACGLKLDWDSIEGLNEALGKNGVTSNYRYDLAPYTWKLVQEMKGKEAIFTQPAMPIKCAGAPQKAMYLSCDHWLRNNQLRDMNVSFCNAGPVLFGCAPYVPPLMEYVKKYGINLDFSHNLIKIDGENKIAWFNVSSENAEHIWMVRTSMYGTPSDGQGYDVFKSTNGGNTWVNWATPTLNSENITNIEHHRGSNGGVYICLLYTSPSPRDISGSRMPSSA